MDPAIAARASGLPPGTRMGRYTLMRRFAVGGMAELYLAHQRGAEGFGKVVALKRILPHLAADPQFTKMFLDEARLAAGLHHPNIAQVLDFGESDGEHFLTMEYVHGRHLLDLLRAQEGRPLPLASALFIVESIARALHHVHEQRGPDGSSLGLVHRDVSPSNVLVSYEGIVKLTDFGIAKAMDLTSTTRAGTFKGKLGYASPEQCRGEHVDRRSDIYALGILLYETTTGVRAFSGPNEFAVLGRVTAGTYLPPEEIDPSYPTALRRIVARALAKDPDDRYATAAEFAGELEELAQATSLHASPTKVGGLMEDTFGPPPPIAAAAELRLGEPTLVDPSSSAVEPTPATAHAPRPRPVILPWAISGVIVAAVVTWALVRDPAPAPPAPVASPAAATAAEPAVAPLVVPAPVVVETPGGPETPAAAPPAPHTQERPSRKPTRGRKRRRGSASGKTKPSRPATDLNELYPPGHGK